MGDKPPARPFRVLILEDHEFQRQFGAQILRLCGAYDVLEAPDGEGALKILAEAREPIDLLVCDLDMPGMDGLAFLRHLGERAIPIAVILASSLGASIIRAAEMMAKSYGVRMIGALEKPLSQTNLMPLVLRFLSQRLVSPRAPLTLSPIEEIEAGLASGQFEPFFQPKVEIKSGALVGVEALARWRHPERGLIPPGAFIPVLEAAGRIDALTFHMIRCSVAQFVRWRDLGLDVPMAVNVAVHSLADTDLPDRIEVLTRAAGLLPSVLTLEITETTAMADIGSCLETLARCRMKGFGLSIDDYGTGFSSMTQLARLPLTELKIDQSFVTGSAGSPTLQALIETSVAVARRLGLKTVAEGVETKEDWDVVARLDCDVAQGYLIARPMPGDQLNDWYRSWLTILSGAKD